MPPDLRLIVNPTAGRGRTRRLVPVLRARLAEHGIAHDLRITLAPGEATVLAQEAAKDDVGTVVAVGGDGTVQEVANGLLGADERPRLGILPSGSGNDLARSAGVPQDLEEGLAALVVGSTRPLDVGWLGPRAFVNGLGIGLDGSVAMRYARMRRFRGQVGYMVGAVQEALTFDAFPLTLACEGWEFEGEALFAGATNGPSHGGDFRIVPQATVDDGLLDVYVFEDMARFTRLLRIPQVRRGEHEELPIFHAVRSTWMEIELERPVPAHLDGEPTLLRPSTYRVEVEGGALSLVVQD